MEAIRTIVSTDILSPVIDLPWTSKNTRLEVIVMPLASPANRRTVSGKSPKGCLKAYANPTLWEKEQYAWENNTAEIPRLHVWQKAAKILEQV